jgi:hypothetical protein
MIYCPKCATPLSEEQKFCRACGFDMQIVSRVLGREPASNAPDQPESADSNPLESRRTKTEMRGLLTLFSALMMGCLIPISMGLFPNWPGLNNLIILLGGVAGFLLFGGILQLVYSDYLPKVDTPKTPVRMTPIPPSVPTNQLPPANPSEVIPSVAEQTTGLLPIPAGDTSRPNFHSKT